MWTSLCGVCLCASVSPFFAVSHTQTLCCTLLHQFLMYLRFIWLKIKTYTDSGTCSLCVCVCVFECLCVFKCLSVREKLNECDKEWEIMWCMCLWANKSKVKHPNQTHLRYLLSLAIRLNWEILIYRHSNNILKVRERDLRPTKLAAICLECELIPAQTGCYWSFVCAAFHPRELRSGPT